MVLSSAWPPAVTVSEQESKGVISCRRTVFKDHGHGRTLVQDAQLALGIPLVGRVGKDAAVQEGAVCVGDHAANVAGAVGLAVGVLGVLERVKVAFRLVLPVERVALVDRVDGAAGRDAHVGVRQDEFAQGIVEREAVNAAALHGDDELRRGAVHGEASGDELGAGFQQVRCAAGAVFGQLVHAKNGADGDTGVEVAAAVDGVAGDRVTGLWVFGKVNDLLLLLRDQHGTLARGAHGGNEEVIANDIELLLVVAGGIGGAREAGEVDETGASDVVGNGLEGELQSVTEEGEVARRFGMFRLFLGEEAGQGDNVNIDLCILDRVGSVWRGHDV